MKKIMLIAASAFFLGALPAVAAQNTSTHKPLRAFAPGEKVAFIGDSITHSCNWVAWLKYIVNTRYAYLPEVEFLNFGIAGDSCWNVKHRLEWDVLPHKFDRAFIMLGMNDCPAGIWGSENPSESEIQRRSSRVMSYTRYMTNIISRLEKSGVEVVLLTPSPFDEYSKDLNAENFQGRNERGIASYAEAVRTLAREHSLSFVEFHRPITEILKKNPDLKMCGRDRVHPRQNGSICMAALVAEAMGIVEHEANKISIDVLDRTGHRISNLPNGGFRFLCDNKILPFPVSSVSSFSRMEKSIESIRKLKSEFLSVKNLSAGNWTLKADGNVIGTFSNEELSKGIDMSYCNTPSQIAAAEAKKAMDKWRDKVVALRNIIMTRQVLRIQKADPYDVEKAMPILDKWLKTGQGKGQDDYFGPIFETFRKMSGREEELRFEVEKAGHEFFARCKGVAYEIEIVPAK